MKKQTTIITASAPETRIYQQIARTIEARLNCIKSNNDWQFRHEDTLEAMNDLLPSGSGIDCGTKINIPDSTPDNLVFHFDYHHMDENGMYDGWTAHTLYVTPSLSSGFHCRITGSNRNNVKDYLYEVYHSAMNEIVDFDDKTKSYFLPSMREAAAQFQAGVKAGTII